MFPRTIRRLSGPVARWGGSCRSTPSAVPRASGCCGGAMPPSQPARRWLTSSGCAWAPSTVPADGAMLPRTKKLAEDLLAGKRIALSRSITLIESTLPAHRYQAELLLDAVVAGSKATGEPADASGDQAPGISPSTFRVGIAGPPGAGKSTFIEALGLYLVNEGHRPAVIAIDPSSTRTGGSILGDKTRMMELSRERRAFVRPSPTRGALGGVAEHTNEVVQLCEAGGFDIVLIETVGLGQSEVVVDSAVDMLILLVPPAGGDELQGVKKGIMEVADMVVVNKADGELINSARHAASDFRRALQLSRRKHPAWEPKVKRCSAIEGVGIDRVWKVAREFQATMDSIGELQAKRTTQAVKWMWSQFESQVLRSLHKDSRLQELAGSMASGLEAATVTPRRASHLLFNEAMANWAKDAERLDMLHFYEHQDSDEDVDTGAEDGAQL